MELYFTQTPQTYKNSYTISSIKIGISYPDTTLDIVRNVPDTQLVITRGCPNWEFYYILFRQFGHPFPSLRHTQLVITRGGTELVKKSIVKLPILYHLSEHLTHTHITIPERRIEGKVYIVITIPTHPLIAIF